MLRCCCNSLALWDEETSAEGSDAECATPAGDTIPRMLPDLLCDGEVFGWEEDAVQL